MQVRVLPAAPLPGGVKVARRFVKPHVLVQIQPWQPEIFTHNQRKSMRTTIRYQRSLLFRKSHKPNRIIRIRPGTKLNLVFRPSRAGPQIKT
jgi:hypothetical protein